MNESMLVQLSNAQLLLWKIKEYSPVTKRELQDITGLSWGLISREVNALVEAGLIVSCSRDSVGAGRKAEEYDINPERNYFIGIDFSYKGLLVAITDMKARIVESVEYEFADVDCDGVLKNIYAIVDDFFAKYSENNIIGIGIAAQGMVDRSAGVSVFATRIKGWNNVPLKNLLEERYKVAVCVEHDPDCVMETEIVLGHLCRTDITDALVITINHSIGIGMSMMLNGQIYHGMHGKAGEIGYTMVGDEKDETGKFLEDHITKFHIVQDYKKLSKTNEDISYREIVERAKTGDPVCLEVFKQVGRYIAFAVCSANNFFNPQMIIFHASSCEFQDLYFEITKEFIRKNTYDKTVELKLSKLGKEVSALGGALIAIENVVFTN